MAFGPEAPEHRDKMRAVFHGGAKTLNAEVHDRALRALSLEWAIHGDPEPSDTELAIISDTVSTTLAAFVDLMGEAGVVLLPREHARRGSEQTGDDDLDDDWDV